MRRRIPGLQRDLYAALAALDHEATEWRVRTLASHGIGEREIARRTGLHDAVVRQILAAPSLTDERGDCAADTPPTGHGGA